jgi:hypothetical protein
MRDATMHGQVWLRVRHELSACFTGAREQLERLLGSSIAQHLGCYDCLTQWSSVCRYEGAPSRIVDGNALAS